jgi:HEPN domain-containing protein
MQPDPARTEDTRAWLAKASMDLRAAQHDFGASPPLYEVVLFHCQQAAEKSLKAFLAWHDHPFRKTHSLEELGRPCCEIDSSLTDVITRALPLTEYAWKFRYPGEPDTPTRDEAEVAMALAREVYGAIATRLPGSVHP